MRVCVVDCDEGVIAARVTRVIRGTTFPAGIVVAPGHVRWDVRGETVLGPFELSPAPQAEIERLADACTEAGKPTAAVADARSPSGGRSSSTPRRAASVP